MAFGASGWFGTTCVTDKDQLRVGYQLEGGEGKEQVPPVLDANTYLLSALGGV